MKKSLHILMIVTVLLLSGCAVDLGPTWRGTGMVLTVRCDESTVTKADDSTRDGEKGYNENLIRSVDFFFYQGASPDGADEAVYHIRRELEEDPMPVNGKWEVPFNLVLTKDIINRIFTTGNTDPEDDNKATVYALVNFEQSFMDTLSHTSQDYLAAIRFTTDFAQNETSYKQPCFIMDGRRVLEYRDTSNPSVEATISVQRFASKITISINVEDSVVLQHDPTTGDAPETWTPVLHTMRVYLVDGVKTVLLSGENEDDPEFFTYSGSKRPFVKNDGAVPPTPYVSKTGDYYETYPMYTYPYKWETDVQKDVAHLDGKYKEPYLKLEMDWTRQPDQDYTFDQRKYYYKVFLPFDEIERNHWYSLSLDVGILGSETDEGKALMQPSCYILDWQNVSEVVNKYAVISKARYLSVDKEVWELNNVNETTIPILSSHIVKIAENTIKVTRPYYGEIKSNLGVGDYHPQYHAWIRKTEGKDEYYLDYVAKEGETRPAADEQKYNPAKWLSNTSTTVTLKHALENDYTSTSFDYSPYTIDFSLVHDDLNPESITYTQYLRHIRIIQYPAIYIVATRNSDKDIKVIDGNARKIPAGYEPLSDQPWKTYPWGFVYVNGGRFLRQYSGTNFYPKSGPHEPYYDLTDGNSQKEYQWQAVWYTGGGRDMFEVNVTVLPASSDFVIGDPRKKEIDNLAPTESDPTRYASMYSFTPANANDKDVLTANFSNTSTTPHYGDDGSRTGFAKAPVAPSIRTDGDEEERTLMYYHPTDNSSRTTNMLAPSFRFASKFGGTEFGEITREAAEYRCAAYQEDGFPAGRWRLPTKAEIKFVVQLSANEAFEHLFEYNKSYWAAQGSITPKTNGFEEGNPSTALLRCVYDSWYWGDTQETDRRVFYWGDKE